MRLKNNLLDASSFVLAHNLAVEHLLNDYLQNFDRRFADAALSSLIEQKQSLTELDEAWLNFLAAADVCHHPETQDAFSRAFKMLNDAYYPLFSMLSTLLERGDEHGDLAESVLIYAKHQNKFIQKIRELISTL